MTTRAQCWKVTRTDAQVFAFTDHDEDLTVGGVTYLSSIGFVPSAIERNTELTTANQTLSGIIDNATITPGDLRSGKWDSARVEIIEADWKTETKLRTLLVGHLGSVDIVGEQYSAVLNSIEAELQKPIGRTVQLRCDANLGDTRCQFALTPESTTVTLVNSNLSFVDTALVQTDARYNGGKLVWTSGLNVGLTFDVKRYQSAGTIVELYEPTPYEINIGDTADIYQGCDKTIDTCRDTFANIENFRGFPYLPGVRAILGGRVA